WTSTNAKTVRDGRGNPLYYFGFVQDITAYKRAELALAETEARDRSLVEQVPAAVYLEGLAEGQNNSLYVSPQIEAISGYSADERKKAGALWSSVVHPDDRERYVKENAIANGTGNQFDLEYRIIHKNGSTVWVRDMAALTKDAEGRPLYWHGILIDVTEQKKFQESIRYSEDRFRKVFESSPVAICITTLENGTFIDANESYLRLSGYGREELIGRTVAELGIVSPAERAKWLEQFLAGGGSAHRLESQFKTASGESLKTLAFYELIELGGRTAILSLFYDTTAQSKAAEALRESEARYHALVENIPAIVFLDPADGSDNTIYINPQVEATLGYTPAEWIADPELWKKCMHPGDRNRVLAEDRRTDLTGDNFSLEYRLISKDGRVVWIQEESTLIRDGQGKPLFWQGFLLDVTKRKEAQHALKQSEGRFETIFQTNPLAISVSTLMEGYFLDVNEAYCQLLGYRREELIGKTADDMKIWDSTEERAFVVRSINASKSIREVNDRLTTRDGRRLDILSFYELIELNGLPCILSMHYDISKQREARDALREIATAYRGLFDSVSDAIYIQNQQGRFLDVNQGAVQMYGYPHEYFLGKTPEALSAPGRNDLDELKLKIEKAFQGVPQEYEFWGIRQNGEVFPKQVRLYKGVYFGEEVVFALAQDITEKKQAEEAVRRREAILEAAAYASERFLKTDDWESCVPDIMARLGQAGEASRIYIFRNKRGAREELLTDQIYEWCAPGITPQADNPLLQNFDYRENGFDFLAELMQNGAILSAAVKDLPPAAQEELSSEDILSILNVPVFVNNAWWGLIGYDECRYERVWSQPEVEALKVAAGILGAVIERSEAAHALATSEEKYRTLIEQASDGIFIADRDGKLLEVNPFGCAMLGYAREELLGIDIRTVLDETESEERPMRLSAMQIGEARTTERHLVRKDGSRLPVEISAKILPDGRLQGIVRDITERRRAADAQERQLNELSVLHALAVVGTAARNEDELLDQATEIIGYTLYPDMIGFLLISESGDKFYPHPSYRGLALPDLMREFPVGDGVTGRVIRSRKSMNIPDVSQVSYYISINPESRSELCVPMIIGDRVIGVINAESSQIGYFTADDERLLLTIAGQLGTAIERLRSEQAEREQRNLAEALRDIAETLNSTLEFNKVLDRILENIGRVVPSQTAMIMLLENGVARAIRHRGFTAHGQSELTDALRINCEEVPDFRRALHTKSPVLISDTRADPEWIVFPHFDWIQSHLLAPILIDKTVIGFIGLDHDQPGFFTGRDEERLIAFTTQAAIALENARLFQEESRRARIIEALAEIANVIATSQDINATLNDIARRSLTLLRASHTAIYLLQDDERTLKIVAAQGAYMEELLSHTIQVGQGITGSVVAAGKPEIIDDTALDPRRRVVPGTPEQESERETMMSVPLTLREKTIGAINAWRTRKDGLFVQSELNFLASIAHQASIAIESGRLFEETVRRAQETAAIAEVGRDISSTLELNSVLERIAVYAKDLLDAETSAVYLVESPQSLRAIASIGKDAEEIKSDPLLLGRGILGGIAAQKAGEIVNDNANDPRAIVVKGTEMIPFEHLMGVPFLSKGELTGLLAVWRTGANKRFKPSELDFLSGLAQQAAIAIENARLFQAEQLRRHEAETLREAIGVVATTLDSGRAVDLILDQLARVLKYDSAAVQLLREGHLEIVGGRGWSTDSAVLGTKFPIPGDNPNTTVILEQRPVILNQTRGTHYPFQYPPHDHIRSWLGVPLVAHDEVIGMLSVDSVEENHFNEEHIRLVTAFANQAAIAIDNARLHEKTEAQILRLTALRDVDTAIASSMDVRVILNILLDQAMSLLHADAMDIMVYNPNMLKLELVAGTGFLNHALRRQDRMGEGIAGTVAITRKMLHIPQFSQSPEFSSADWLRDEKFVTYVAFPLLGKGQIKGVFEAFFRAFFPPSEEWLEFMQTLAGQAAIAIDNTQLFENLQRSNQELSLAYDTTLEGWGKALELRDKETQGHTRRVTELTVRLAKKMGVSEMEIVHIRRGVLLHDIGKMGVPDHILRKTGELTNEEWGLMRLHPQYAFDLLYPIAYLRLSLDIPYCHHEKWDGSGYPRGLKEREIPLAARIFSVVDVWDALLSDRPYRNSWSKEKAMEYIRTEAGTHFDPDIVRVFLQMIAEEK
ncbi:MAG: PAS domain S-box protein, partial [Chloroflexota bacterium]